MFLFLWIFFIEWINSLRISLFSNTNLFVKSKLFYYNQFQIRIRRNPVKVMVKILIRTFLFGAMHKFNRPSNAQTVRETRSRSSQTTSALFVFKQRRVFVAVSLGQIALTASYSIYKGTRKQDKRSSVSVSTMVLFLSPVLIYFFNQTWYRLVSKPK